MTYSQNGWIANRESLIGTHTIPGTDIRLRIRNGDVAVILTDLASEIHHKVEKLNPQKVQWCWGYAFREIRGGGSVSNHGSGTAIDLNAPAHPLGARGTWSRVKKKKIDKILGKYEGTVRWGENYTTRKDGMHFEINASSRAVGKVADKIRKENAKKKASTKTGSKVNILPKKKTPVIPAVFDQVWRSGRIGQEKITPAGALWGGLRILRGLRTGQLRIEAKLDELLKQAR